MYHVRSVYHFSLFNRIKMTATQGACERCILTSLSMHYTHSNTRFIQAFKDWSASQVMQSRNRSKLLLPSVEDFILMRRNTIGAALVEGSSSSSASSSSIDSEIHILAMVEYSLDLDLPDYVFRDPVVIAMSEATTDIMTWPNVRVLQPSRKIIISLCRP